jgi:aqualysin 1
VLLLAGTIGSFTYGVTKSANLVGVKVLSNAGSGLNSAVIAGVEWVPEQALNERDCPKVCNLSLGGFISPALDKYVSALITEGLVFTAVVAGNDNGNACLSSPANAYGVMSVGATDRNDQCSSFSNFGPCVDIFGEFSFLVTILLLICAPIKSSQWFVSSAPCRRLMSCSTGAYIPIANSFWSPHL